jgi:hypothetical protein
MIHAAANEPGDSYFMIWDADLLGTHRGSSTP